MLAYGLDRPGSGIARYAVELMTALRDHQPDIEFTILKPFMGPIPELDDLGATTSLPGARLLPAMMTIGPGEIAAVAARHRLHIIHDPAGISPFIVPRSIGRFRRIVTIHDMIPFVYPETHARLTNLLFRQYIPRTLRFVDRVVTVSDASKRDVQRFYPIGPDRIERIYCGCHPRFRPQPASTVAATLALYGVEPPYLLTVGALQARKNLESVFEAFAWLRASGLPHRLVVVGRTVWKAEGVFRRLDDLNLGDSVHLTGYVDDADLPALYAGADCFLYPSLYEGFGLPPLEAMACGTPVVTSDVSSLPEVVGDAGIMVEPRDVDAIVRAVCRIIESPDFARDLRERGIARARTFTWERAAAEHAALYREVARSVQR
jgi:glycosyltransferase involved in cell wall biosynthesis